MPKPKYAPSPDLTEAEIDALMIAPLSDDETAVLSAPPEIEMISVGELLLLNIETRIGRIADACEAANKIKTAGRDDIVGLTAQVHRLADALDSIAAVFGCITESVESDADGVTRCYVRTRDDNHGFFLGQRDERE
jgi:hypothetical protein